MVVNVGAEICWSVPPIHAGIVPIEKDHNLFLKYCFDRPKYSITSMVVPRGQLDFLVLEGETFYCTVPP